MAEHEDVLRALYRSRVLPFAERAMTILEPDTSLSINWHHEAIAYELERCFRGESRRLIVNQPPKTLKTHLISVSFVTWLLAHDPSLRIAIVCYDEALASTQLRKIRQLMRSAWYRKLAPRSRIRKEKDTESLFETTAGGEVRALSVQGGITGHGFDFIIIDDPQKASLAHSETERHRLEELYSSSIANRWRNPAKGVLIVVMQRLHVDDFTAFLLRTGRKTVHLSIPAIAPYDMTFQVGEEDGWLFPKGALLEPERLSAEVLAELLALQGKVHFSAQYLQAPESTGGRVLERAWFKPLTGTPQYDFRVISIDPAFTENGGDFSAALICDMVGENVHLIHAEQVQFSYPELVRWIRDLDRKWKPDLLLIETIGAGKGLGYYLESFDVEHIRRLETHNGLSKLRRMEMVSPMIEAGRVLLPFNEEWARKFLNVVTEFPNGASDDWADALSQLLMNLQDVRFWARYHRNRRFPPPPPPDPFPQRRRSIYYQRIWV